MKQEYIDKFKRKQGFEAHKQIDDRVYAFDGFFFDVDDIVLDIDREVSPGLIKLYANEGLNGGSLPSYDKWLLNNFGQ